ncbi:MAG: hypothetical protein K2X77_00395 [Candidatus Obscuribacterales bacterium]|jgi:hypothetical protein|nr:hypothetical protein [Candidatus Obscuribacterales bacterium]
MKKLFGILAISLISFGNCSQAFAGDMNDLRNKRYGEVLLGRGGLVVPNEFDVYNTIGLNDCPEELWSKLDPEKIKADTGAKAVKLNGPRYWTIDGLRNSVLLDKEIKSFGGIQMRHAGTLKLSIKDKLSIGKPYVEHQVARKTIWVFQANKPVYQLISPDGSVYFMQSYSVQKEKQDPDGLTKLANKLSLQNGWKFRTVTLKKDFEVQAINGVAVVVQDDLDNTYQKSTAKESDNL